MPIFLDPRELARRLREKVVELPAQKFKPTPKVSPVDLARRLKPVLTEIPVGTSSGRNAERLVVLRLGLGRDSMTMLVLLAQRKLVIGEGEPPIGPADVDAVVFTDPGHEWQFTYDLIPRVQAFCDRYKLRFIVQNKPPAEGPYGWIAWGKHQMEMRVAAEAAGKSRVGTFGVPFWRTDPRWRRPHTIEERAAGGWYATRIPLFDDYSSKDAWINHTDPSCTINHKIEPMRELTVDLAKERLGADASRWSELVASGLRQPHLMLIGYAADEEKRLREATRIEKEAGKNVTGDAEAYPLVLMGIKKTDEQAILDSSLGIDAKGRFVIGGFSDVKKSGCAMCKEQDRAQFWMLRELDPKFFARVLDLERRVVARTGPWQAFFPAPFKKLLMNRKTHTWEDNPKIKEIPEGVRWAVKTKKWNKKLSQWEDIEEEAQHVYVFVPLSQRVAEWEAEYIREHGRRPDVEEVARKEYRSCKVSFA